MFGLGPATKIYVCLDSVDMRKGFDGLYGLVRDRLEQDPRSGHLFLFTNRTRTRLKALVWDGRIMDLREAVGAWPFQLAGGERSAEHHHAAGRAGDARERNGSHAGAPSQELDA